jgi:probable phosphoglycerate mutase
VSEIVLARHGETAWSRSGQHTSFTDVELTPAGEEQARALGERLDGQQFSLVLSSPRRRALDTCRLAGWGDAVQVRDALTEWSYGDYEGITTDEIHRTRPGWNLFRDGAPGGETAASVAARLEPVLAELRAATGRVLVVSHGHLLRVLAARWAGWPAADGERLGTLGTASISRLGDERGTPAVLAWNT